MANTRYMHCHGDARTKQNPCMQISDCSLQISCGSELAADKRKLVLWPSQDPGSAVVARLKKLSVPRDPKVVTCNGISHTAP